jgi:16S rRNA (uracil1498-N3)-methyltransferase
MRNTRIYTPQTLQPADTIQLEDPASHYLLRVLRLSAGDAVTLFNGDGRDYRGEISGVQRQRVLVRLTDSHDPANESPLKITLVQAISRGERMDYTLQKATELGVFCIQPVTCSRVEVHLSGTRLARRMAHWQGVVVSACEQSGRAVVPEIKTPLSLAQWLATSISAPGLVLDPEALRKLSVFSIQDDSVSILVGPEGGFSSEEIEQIRINGIWPVSLGPRVLRSETAGPAAITVLQATTGDL